MVKNLILHGFFFTLLLNFFDSNHVVTSVEVFKFSELDDTILVLINLLEQRTHLDWLQR